MNSIDLDITTDDENIEALCKKYWELKDDESFLYTVKSLSKQYGFKSHIIRKLVQENSNAYSQSIFCRRCSTPYIYSSRTDLQTFHSTIWTCDVCMKDLQTIELEKLHAKKSLQKSLIESEYLLSTRQSMDLSSISLKHAVSLLSVIRLTASENFQIILPISTAQKKLAPTSDYQYKILVDLYNEDLLYVHPHSNSEAFNFDVDNTKIESFYPLNISWALPIEEKITVEKLETTFQNMEWEEGWDVEIKSIWKEIALNECLEYLLYIMKDHGFDFKPGDKTILTINNILNDFSVSQIFNFIWSAAKSAASYYMREKPPKQQAANSVVGTLQRNAERAKAEQWDITHYKRDRRCPQTMISEVFFNAVLQIGDEGFNKPPQ